MASRPQQISLDINALRSFITAINERNPGISSFTWGWGTSTPSDCLPICIKLQSPPPANRPLNLGKIIVGLTFHAVLALFFSSPSSSPPIPTVLFGASFAVSCAGICLQNAFPRVALVFEKIGALFAAIGVCNIANLLLIHQNYAWICWLPCAFSLLAFILSFK